MNKYETDPVRKSQAALEAVEVLKNAGFDVSNFYIGPEPESEEFKLDLTLSLLENERPLEE